MRRLSRRRPKLWESCRLSDPLAISLPRSTPALVPRMPSLPVMDEPAEDRPGRAELSYSIPSYPAAPSAQSQEQLAYQHMYQQHIKNLQQQLQAFWVAQQHEIASAVVDFKTHALPLAQIKKIMKADEDVRMIAAEAPVLFARACEMFVLELTLRAWAHTEENKRRTLQKNDIAAAITRTDVFDFLVDTVPRDEVKEDLLMAVPGEPAPYYYMPAAQAVVDPTTAMMYSVQQYSGAVAPPLAWPAHQSPTADS